jgi:hypothetical protein
MSFWMGMARAYQDADTKKTEDRRINEERAFATEQRDADRKWEEDFFFRKLSAETKAQRQNLLLQGGGARRSGTGGGSSSGDSNVPLTALMKAFPGLDPEVVAQLAPYPEQVTEVYNTLTEKRQEYANARIAWTPEMANGFISDILPTDGEDLSSERIQSIAQMYGVNPNEEIYSGSGITWGDQIRRNEMVDPSATVITDPSALPDPMKPEEQRLYQEQIKGRLGGYLDQQVQQLQAEFGARTEGRRNDAVSTEDSRRVQDEIASINALKEQVKEGYLDEALNSEYGTRAIQDMWDAGNVVEYQRMFPMFKPHFASTSELSAAVQSEFVKPGQNVKLLVTEGNFQELSSIGLVSEEERNKIPFYVQTRVKR